MLLNSLSHFFGKIQGLLFPKLEEEFGELNEKHKKVVSTLEMVRVEEFIETENIYRPMGRPKQDRTAIARAFIAKAVYHIGTTRQLIDRIVVDPVLRRICGWERRNELPSEATFSRAFEEFANSRLPERVHAALISETVGKTIVGHVSRDSTKIKGREKPKKKEKKLKKHKKGRRKKGEKNAKEPTRLEKQKEMSLDEMLKELPGYCDVGCKKNSNGYKETWIGYKLHIDATDGQIPISCILTSASVHDSQVALPLGEISKSRVTNCYDLMDSAYDCPIIREHSESLGHVPIIDVNTRRNTALKEEIAAEKKRLELIHLKMPETLRYNERSSVERVNGRLKDEFGGNTVRVRGKAKVMAHLMFGILALTADQLLRLVV